MEIGFGGEDDLVVITEDEFISDDCDEGAVPLYRKTFQQPEFNPRWKYGTTDHFEQVDV